MKKLALPVLVLLAALCASAQQPKVQWAKFGGSKIRYYDTGGKKKDALVFVHGWTCNADFWKDSMNAFPGYRVIALDLIGHGQSDKPKADYSMEYFARSIDAVIKTAGVQKAVLVGHSMGTPVVRQYYRLYPAKTLGIVIVDGALRPFGPKEQTEKYFGPMFGNYKEQAPKFVDGLLGPTRTDLKPKIRAEMLATPDYVATSAMKGMLDDKIWIDDTINVPVLAVMASSPWPPDTETAYRKIAPNLNFVQWTGVSHFLMMEKPAEFNALVGDFLAAR